MGHSLPESQWAEGHREGQTWLAERANAQTQEGDEGQDAPSKARAPGRVLKTQVVAPTSMLDIESQFDCLSDDNQHKAIRSQQKETESS